MNIQSFSYQGRTKEFFVFLFLFVAGSARGVQTDGAVDIKLFLALHPIQASS
jgi:hypothetical protein